MKSSILVLLSPFVISIVISQPVKESGIDDSNITEYEAHRYPRDLKPDPPPCRINQYFDAEENKCMGIMGGGKAVHINNSASCDGNTLKPHCISPRYYYICAGSKIILAQCPDGRHYEDRLQKCILVPRDKYISVTNRSNRLPACESPGTFPTPDDCALFYTCTKNFLGMHQNFYRCPQRMIYDIKTGLCSPSDTCDNSPLPLLCPLNSTRVISNEATHLVRRSKPTGQERTKFICREVYLSEEEGTTESIESEVTDSLITELDNDTASTAERHRSTTTGRSAEEPVTEFQTTTSENPFTDIIEMSSTEPTNLLVAGTTEEYYENTPAFTSTNLPSSESEITSTRNTSESSTPIIFTESIDYDTTEVDGYTTSKEFFEESQSTIIPNVTSDILEELDKNNASTEESFNDNTISTNTELSTENSITTSTQGLSTLQENDQTTTDQIELTDINEESLIPFNDLPSSESEITSTRNTSESSTPIIFTESIDYGTTEVDGYTTSKEFFEEIQSTIVPNVTSDILEELDKNNASTEESFNDNTISTSTEFSTENSITTSTQGFSTLHENDQTTTDQIELTDINEESLIPFNDSTTESNSEETSSEILDDATGISYTTDDATDATRKHDSPFSSTDAVNDLNTLRISTTEGIVFSESAEIIITTNDLSSSITLGDVTSTDTEQTTADPINTSTPISENNAFFDLQLIPQGNNFETSTDSNSDELSTYTSDVTENGVRESNSWNTDNSETSEADENDANTKIADSPPEMKTISKNVILPIASRLLNVTDQLERYMQAVLIEYLTRYGQTSR